jgi:hypothetical protein
VGPAEVIDAAADAAPDAPARSDRSPPPPSGAGVVDRDGVLAVARDAIARNLTRP